jgi:UDP-N-acetyl-D-mannosaminuronic acid dehydrogenase
MNVGILGAAFKSESDDIRESLSYKLRKILEFKASKVFITDPHVTIDSNLKPLEEVLRDSDILILATPHSAYKEIVTEKPVIDIWNLLNNGNLI